MRDDLCLLLYLSFGFNRRIAISDGRTRRGLPLGGFFPSGVLFLKRGTGIIIFRAFIYLFLVNC